MSIIVYKNNKIYSIKSHHKGLLHENDEIYRELHNMLNSKYSTDMKFKQFIEIHTGYLETSISREHRNFKFFIYTLSGLDF